jgi:2-methylcitrate dehydratase PrpD
MGLVNTLSSHVCQTSYDDLPDAVITATKDRIIDFLGVALSGYSYNVHKPALKALEKHHTSSEASVIGEGVKLPCDLAAFVNSSLCFDMTDGSRAAALHPGPVVIPAALAAAEVADKASGKDLMLAIALGYEVMIRVGRAMNPSAVKRGFHPTSIVGPLGSAVAAGKIMNLNGACMSNALSIAAVSGSGLLDALRAPEPFAQVQIAGACHAGILSVLLGQNGIKGTDSILEGAFMPAFSDRYSLEVVTTDLGTDYMIPKTYIKMHAGCRHIHAPIDAALHTVNSNGINWRDIQQISVRTYSVALDLEIEEPKTGDEAKFNIPFGIAVALVHGNAFVDRFTDQDLMDRRIQKLMRTVVVQHDPELDRDYPVKRGARVEITTKGGSVFRHTVDLARGEPECPYSRSEIEDKFRYLTSGVIGLDVGQRIVEFVNRLETTEEISRLFVWLKVRT